jgi:hypothetical protein
VEQQENKNDLTSEINVYTHTSCMGRPRKPEDQRRSRSFLLRLTPGEMATFEAASRRLGETVADIFRKGAKLYAERDKDGSKRKEKNL